MIDVIKRDGSRQPFSEQKIRESIEAAAKEANLSETRIHQIIEDASREPIRLSKRETPVETKILRDKILGRLDTIEPSVSRAWRLFDGKKKNV
jgi:transcriptional regulator NrdR family protein